MLLSCTVTTSGLLSQHSFHASLCQNCHMLTTCRQSIWEHAVVMLMVDAQQPKPPFGMLPPKYTILPYWVDKLLWLVSTLHHALTAI